VWSHEHTRSAKNGIGCSIEAPGSIP
jgi:hypothetical protein